MNTYLIPSIRSTLPMLFLISGLLLVGGTCDVHAAKDQFEVIKIHVNVASIGHVDLRDPAISFDFFADLQTGFDGSASGVMQFVLVDDGSVRRYHAVAGSLERHPRRRGLQAAFVLLPLLPSGELDPTNPMTAVAREDAQTDDCIIWDLTGSDIHLETLRFEIPGAFRRTRIVGPRPPARPWFSLHYPTQKAVILGTDMIVRFRAAALVLDDHRIRGRVGVVFPDLGALRFEPLFGTAAREQETGPVTIIILMALEGAALRLENLFVATVRPDPGVPGCDIWDFMSNGVSDVPNFQFDAQGRIKFHERSASDPGPSPRELAR